MITADEEAQLTCNLISEIAKNRKSCTKRSSSCFADKVFCGKCGALYGSKTWNSTSKYKRTVWQCNSKYKERGV